MSHLFPYFNFIFLPGITIMQCNPMYKIWPLNKLWSLKLLFNKERTRKTNLISSSSDSGITHYFPRLHARFFILPADRTNYMFIASAHLYYSSNKSLLQQYICHGTLLVYWCSLEWISESADFFYYSIKLP